MSYDFLKTVTSPRHMVLAISFMGLKEVVGKGKSNPIIMGWAKDLGLEGIYHDDDEAWCALFYNWGMWKVGRGLIFPGNNKYNYIRALRAQYATNLIYVDIKDAAFGDSLIFTRPEGGHVGWYVGEDEFTFHVLGGNSGNMVKVVKILKSRCVAVRRPAYISYSPDKMIVDIDGDISSNEA